ncbi:MAG: GAF domain-containing sensor histidine kinase, partial [Longimicrobiales bacterium]
LWAALVFSQQVAGRTVYLLLALFPPLWSYIAIYRLDEFLLAALPAVLFLSLATAWTAWTFFRFHRQVRSYAALFLAATLWLWSLHHLDYPFLRARGVWNPWGYYIDVLFTLGMGLGILLLVQEDLQRGVRALSALSGDLQGGGRTDDLLEELLGRPLTLPAVRGSALYLSDPGTFARGAGECAEWTGQAPEGDAATAIAHALATGEPGIVRNLPRPRRGRRAGHAYIAALPVLQQELVAGALVVVGGARDPFAALDTPFLVALGQQVGAALENADLYRRLRVRTGELERLAARMVRQHEEERRRLSRELHDETAQVFAAVSMQLGLLREHASPEASPRLDRALALVDDGIRSIRSVTADLRPSLLDDLGLLPALRGLVDDFRDNHSIDVRFNAPDVPPRISKEAELAIFRALQEALSNVARHAHASRIDVRLGAVESRVVLSIADDGRGIPADRLREPGASAGLAGMRERLAALGGQLMVEPADDHGVLLVISVPADPESAA